MPAGRSSASTFSAALLWCLFGAPTVGEAVLVDVGSASAPRAGHASFLIHMHSEGESVAGVSVDVTSDPHTPFAYTDLGKPRCRSLCDDDYQAPTGAAAALTDGGGAKKDCASAAGFRPPGCEPGVTCSGVRLLDLAVSSTDPIPSDAALFECTVDIRPDAPVGVYALDCDNATTVDPSGKELPTTCVGGGIDVVCAGDCSGDGEVSIDELVLALRIGTEEAPLDLCPAADANADGVVTIDDIVKGRSSLLDGCDASILPVTPTPTPKPGPVRFAPAQRYSAGPYPGSIRVADFNHDGIPDVAATYIPITLVLRTFHWVAVLLGQGDGTLGSAASYRVGDGPIDVDVGDVQGDGAPDLVVANVNTPYSVSVLPGVGDGTFAAQQMVPVSSRPFGVSLRDVNRDGFPDLVAASERLSVSLGRGDGTFLPEILSPRCGGELTVADVTGDGIVDVVEVGAGLCVRAGSGDGSFAMPVISQENARSAGLAAADLEGDGDIDLVTVSPLSGGVVVLRNRGDGAFEARGPYAVGAGAPAVAVADLNGDGLLDVAVANHESRDVSVLLAQSSGDFTAQLRFSVGRFSLPTDVAVADFNQDDVPDIVTTNTNTHDVSVLLQIR